MDERRKRLRRDGGSPSRSIKNKVALYFWRTPSSGLSTTVTSAKASRIQAKITSRHFRVAPGVQPHPGQNEAPQGSSVPHRLQDFLVISMSITLLVPSSSMTAPRAKHRTLPFPCTHVRMAIVISVTYLYFQKIGCCKAVQRQHFCPQDLRAEFAHVLHVKSGL